MRPTSAPEIMQTEMGSGEVTELGYPVLDEDED
jgi:hypothetical protein